MQSPFQNPGAQPHLDPVPLCFSLVPGYPQELPLWQPALSGAGTTSPNYLGGKFLTQPPFPAPQTRGEVRAGGGR